VGKDSRIPNFRGFRLNGSECARKTLEFAKEMRKVDPIIRFVAVGCEGSEWNLEMIKNAGEYFDYLSVHIYIKGERSYRELAATSLDIERRLEYFMGLFNQQGKDTIQKGRYG